jgi:hypothetical protein
MRTTKIAWASPALVPILAPGLEPFARRQHRDRR